MSTGGGDLQGNQEKDGVAMNHAGDYLRLLISVCLLSLVYLETGGWTTICLLLILARAEVQDYNSGITFKKRLPVNH